MIFCSVIALNNGTLANMIIMCISIATVKLGTMYMYMYLSSITVVYVYTVCTTVYIVHSIVHAKSPK
jgi:hypothetical protein